MEHYNEAAAILRRIDGVYNKLRLIARPNTIRAYGALEEEMQTALGNLHDGIIARGSERDISRRREEFMKTVQLDIRSRSRLRSWYVSQKRLAWQERQLLRYEVQARQRAANHAWLRARNWRRSTNTQQPRKGWL
jgi:hypothetical protein